MATGAIRAFYRNHGGDVRFIESSDSEQLRQALADQDGLLWVDLLIAAEEDGRVLEDVFRFHPLTIEDSVTPRVDPAKIDDHGDYLFIVVQALTGYTPDEELQAVEADFYLGPN